MARSSLAIFWNAPSVIPFDGNGSALIHMIGAHLVRARKIRAFTEDDGQKDHTNEIRHKDLHQLKLFPNGEQSHQTINNKQTDIDECLRWAP